jgi:hypothetical protein
MGFSNLQSSEVPLVSNLNTGSITPQFHVFFDCHFTTVSSIGKDDSPPNHWADLCLENSISILEDQETSDKSPISLNDEWLTAEELFKKRPAHVQSTSIKQTYNTTSFIQGKSINPTQSDVTLNIQSTTEAPVLQALDPKIQSESEDASVVDSRETPDISMKSDTRAISSREITNEPKNTKDNQINSLHFGQLCHTASLQTCPSTRHLDTLDPRIYFAQWNLFLSSSLDSPSKT